MSGFDFREIYLISERIVNFIHTFEALKIVGGSLTNATNLKLRRIAFSESPNITN